VCGHVLAARVVVVERVFTPFPVVVVLVGLTTPLIVGEIRELKKEGRQGATGEKARRDACLHVCRLVQKPN